MATTPVTPKPADPTNLTAEHISTLLQHHVTVSYLVLAVLGVVLALVAVGGYLGLKAYGNAVAHAEAIEAQYDADRKVFAQTLAEHDAQRAQDAKQEAQLLAQIAQRDNTPPPAIVSEGLKPDASVSEVKNALQSVLSDHTPPVTPTITDSGQIAVSPTGAQQLVTDELDLSRLQADFRDQTVLYTTEKQDNALLTQDLNKCKGTLSEANQTIDVWKKAAKKSKWQKFLSGSKTALLIAASAYVGHKL